MRPAPPDAHEPAHLAQRAAERDLEGAEEPPAASPTHGFTEQPTASKRPVKRARTSRGSPRKGAGAAAAAPEDRLSKPVRQRAPASHRLPQQPTSLPNEPPRHRPPSVGTTPRCTTRPVAALTRSRLPPPPSLPAVLWSFHPRPPSASRTSPGPRCCSAATPAGRMRQRSKSWT